MLFWTPPVPVAARTGLTGVPRCPIPAQGPAAEQGQWQWEGKWAFAAPSSAQFVLRTPDAWIWPLSCQSGPDVLQGFNVQASPVPKYPPPRFTCATYYNYQEQVYHLPIILNQIQRLTPSEKLLPVTMKVISNLKTTKQCPGKPMEKHEDGRRYNSKTFQSTLSATQFSLNPEKRWSKELPAKTSISPLLAALLTLSVHSNACPAAAESRPACTTSSQTAPEWYSIKHRAGWNLLTKVTSAAQLNFTRLKNYEQGSIPKEDWMKTYLSFILTCLFAIRIKYLWLNFIHLSVCQF